VNLTTLKKKKKKKERERENLTKYNLLVVTNISEDEHFGLGEFYKMPKRLADSDVSVDEHSAQK